MRFIQILVILIGEPYLNDFDFRQEFTDQKAVDSGLASMCILTSLVYLVDVVFSVINLKNA